MDLWNEYEGRSIDGLFPLEHLIRPEGRSAFFSTSSAGTSTMIRLIESHFDEDEILARWTGVSDLHQPNLLTLIRFGQTTLDETSLVYVVLEPSEADLSQILCERPLTIAETRQVADSLIPALQALHAKNFIHEHIEPGNVLAVGEVVKLRSDCIREAPEGAEGTALKTRDVQDLATLLLQCLTQQRSHTISPTGPPLPAPFREIIHNGISGAWDLARMAAALEVTAPRSIKVPEPRVSAESTKIDSSVPSTRPAVPSTPVSSRQSEETISKRTEPNQPSLPHRLSEVGAARHVPEPAPDRISVPLRQQSRSLPPGIFLAIAIAGILIVAAYTLFYRGGSKVTAVNSPSSPVANQPPASEAPTPAIPPGAVSAPDPIRPHPTSVSHEQWRVVAFTYNKQAEANAKARDLERRFASLHPSVFTPTGHAPYLVTMGGPLTRDAAFRLKKRLHGEGLPRDVYAQNYSSK